MLRLTLIPLAFLGCSLINPARAQYMVPVQVAPATKLEAFETNTSVVILKASTDLGSISGRTGTVVVKCRETTDTSTGRKEQGIAIVITPKGQAKETLLIDYDEIASLMAALQYLGQVGVTVTPLATFDASYTTKGGFRVAALGSRLTGAVQFAVRDARNNSVPIFLSSIDLNRLSSRIEQAKTTLDGVRGG